MYFKLIFRNVRKHINDYLIYFVTLMLSVSMFYAFNAAISPTVFKTLNIGMQNMSDGLRNIVGALSYIIGGMIAFLIVYANQFLLKRRKKELGTYMLLGMDKEKISAVFVGETFLIGLISLVAGLLLGVPFSQGLSMMALQLFGGDLNNFQLVFFMPSLKNTLICFAIIYIIVMLVNVLNISGVKLIDLLRAERTNQSFTPKNRFVYLVCFLAAIVLFILTSMQMNWDGLYPDKQKSIIILIGIITGTVLFFYSLFAVVLNSLKAKQVLYLKKLNTFLLRQLESRVQTNFLSMSVVCLLLAITILLTASGFSIAGAMSKLSREALPWDMYLMADAAKLGDSDVIESAKKYGVDLSGYLDRSIQVADYYDSELTYENIFTGQMVDLWEINKTLPQSPVRFISESDYNKCMAFQGKAPISLGENEFLINCTQDDVKDELNGFLQSKGELSVKGRTLLAKQDSVLSNIWFLSSPGSNDRGTFIVPDDVVNTLIKGSIALQAYYKQGADTTKVEKLLWSLTNKGEDITAELLDYGFGWVTKSRMISIYNSANALPVYLCVYLGIVFLIICVTLLALQQLTEIADNVKRYGLLRKLGADDNMLDHTLFGQIGIYFITPVVLASIFVAFGMRKIMNIINVFMGMKIDVNITLTILMFLLVYGGYFIATYLSCKRMVHETEN